MRSIAIMGIASAFLIGGSAAGMAGQTLDRIIKNKTLVNVVGGGYPPFSYIDDKGDMVGFDIDVSKEIAKRLGVAYKVEAPSWEIIVAGHWNGRWDICVCSMTPTKQRGEVLDFVNEYYSTPANILVNPDNSDIKSAADLTGRKIGVQSGTTYEKYVKKELVIDIPKAGAQKIDYPFGDLTAVPYDSEDTEFQDLALGGGKRLDAVISGYLSAADRVKKMPDKFKIVGDAVFDEPLWVAVEKGDPEWDAKIKEIFKQMYDDGTMKAISVKWIGTDVSSKQ